jgi:hypothetical protein
VNGYTCDSCKRLHPTPKSQTGKASGLLRLNGLRSESTPRSTKTNEGTGRPTVRQPATAQRSTDPRQYLSPQTYGSSHPYPPNVKVTTPSYGVHPPMPTPNRHAQLYLTQTQWRSQFRLPPVTALAVPPSGSAQSSNRGKDFSHIPTHGSNSPMIAPGARNFCMRNVFSC